MQKLNEGRPVSSSLKLLESFGVMVLPGQSRGSTTVSALRIARLGVFRFPNPSLAKPSNARYRLDAANSECPWLDAALLLRVGLFA